MKPSSKIQFTSILVLVLNIFLFSSDNARNPNPLLYQFNQNINFQSFSVDDVNEATEKAVENAKGALEKIYNVNDDERNFKNTMLALDNIFNDFNNVFGEIYLMANVNPDDNIREKANESTSVLSKYLNEIGLDEKLYKAVKSYSETEEAKNLTGYKQKFLEEALRDFERNGFALSKEKRDELKVYQDKIADLDIEFSKNIAEVDDYLIVDERDMEGLDEEYKKSHMTEDGKYKIDLSYPSYIPFMKFSKSEKARKDIYFKYVNRASEKNLEVLDQILAERKKMIKLLGYKTYAEYQLEERMAKTPEIVWNFENDLISKVKEKAEKDYLELLEVKKAYVNDENISVIQPWESSFYNNLLLKDKYQVDQQKVKEYFELNNVKEGLFKIAQHLFDVKFEEVENPLVWHEDVKAFNIVQDGKVISRFYMDLYPRANKYSHAACFPIISGKETPNGYQMPVAALVCNFPAPTEDQPSLLSHSEVETFFHEFGHVLHSVLTKSELSSFAGTSVARDFVETPSQILENWTWDYSALQLFARHYKTDELLPRDLFEKMIAAKNVGSGLSTLQQIFYGIIDMTLHDKFDPEGSETTTEVVKRLQNSITLYPYLEGTHMQAAFGHLTGYAAGYYSYLWALVYAQDMFSVFEKNGVMDKNTGILFRDVVLAKGSSEKEINLVKEFLGREPNQDAFLKSLGL